MHLYHAEMEDRRRVFWLLATAATSLSVVIGALINNLFSAPPAILGPPSATVLFGGLFWAYDSKMWAWGIGPLRLSKIPPLAGTWTGEITIERSEGDAAGRRVLPCYVQVKQTWLRMSVDFYTTVSHSISSSATLRGPRHPIGDFRYEYHVQAKDKSGEIERDHEGVARLTVQNDDWGDLDGNFFNDQNFQRFGDYCMKKLPTSLTFDDWLKTLPA